MNQINGLKIAWHTWEPGLFGDGKASSGGSAWMSRLFHDLINHEGAEIHWVSPTKLAPSGCKSIHPKLVAKTCDILVAAWRWSMPNYPDRDRLYHQQWEIISAMRKAGKRVIVHDQDLMICEEDYLELSRIGVEIYEPSFSPAPLSKQLFFPNPYPNDSLRRQIEVQERYLDLTYIGNNYGRFSQTQHFLGEFSKHYKTTLYGNWIEENVERETPAQVREGLPYVSFPGRLAQEQVIETLQKAKTTIHLCKPLYLRHGFVTIRWAEAVKARCIPFVPGGFELSSGWKRTFEDLGLLVYDSLDMANAMPYIADNRTDIIEEMENFVKRFMRVQPWIDLLEKPQGE